jgi:hypothetical protein
MTSTHSGVPRNASVLADTEDAVAATFGSDLESAVAQLASNASALLDSVLGRLPDVAAQVRAACQCLGAPAQRAEDASDSLNLPGSSPGDRHRPRERAGARGGRAARPDVARARRAPPRARPLGVGRAVSALRRRGAAHALRPGRARARRPSHRLGAQSHVRSRGLV